MTKSSKLTASAVSAVVLFTSLGISTSSEAGGLRDLERKIRQEIVAPVKEELRDAERKAREDRKKLQEKINQELKDFDKEILQPVAKSARTAIILEAANKCAGAATASGAGALAATIAAAACADAADKNLPE